MDTCTEYTGRTAGRTLVRWCQVVILAVARRPARGERVTAARRVRHAPPAFEPRWKGPWSTQEVPCVRPGVLLAAVSVQRR